MLTTINYTNRAKINKQDFKITTFETGDGALEFDFAIDRLKTEKFSNTAKIYLEAHANLTRQIFDCGTVSNFQLPINRKLDELDRSYSPAFSIKIVEESGGLGRILASGAQFKANDDPDLDVELLPVVSHDLGQVPWKVDFSARPHELIINSNIPNGIELFKSDAAFKALVLPAAFKQILTHHLSNDNEDLDENSKNWFLLAESLFEEKPDDDDLEILNGWIEGVISEFCMQHRWTEGLVLKFEEDNN